LVKALQALNEPHASTFNARMNRQQRQRQQHGDKPVLYKRTSTVNISNIHIYIYIKLCVHVSWKLFCSCT